MIESIIGGKAMKEEAIETLVKGHIVVGIDGSESSKNALRWAASLSPTISEGIDVFVIWEYPTMLGWEGGIPEWLKPDEDAKKILDATLKSVFGENLPKGLVGRIHEGHAASVLIEASKSAKMLVVGSRGHGGFAGLLLGSVSSACAERAACPVLVVHEKESTESKK
jgi:nucleotide-binding universal stress UspA family protein